MDLRNLLLHNLLRLLRVVKNLPPYSANILHEAYHTLKYCHTTNRDEVGNLAELMVAEHVLEKGVTMPDRRLGFGQDRVRSLISRCRKYISKYNTNCIEIQSALNILEQYYIVHTENNFDLPKDIVDSIKELLCFKTINTKHCFEVDKHDYFGKVADFREFAHQRHSVRWYSDEHIPDSDIIDAIHLAQTAPSACNRQSTKVYVISDKQKKQQVLKLQHGNRGFGHLADRLLLITFDIRYWSCNHRSMGYIDSGIFTMNLLYALHYYKICACTLNANLSNKNRKKLLNIVGASKTEVPAVFIAIGKAPDHFMIPGSQRLQTQQVYRII